MVLLTDLNALVAQLRSRGFRVIGPTLRDGAIVLAEMDSAAQLPYGWQAEASPGRYRLRRTEPTAFAHSAGPQSWKTFVHPPRRPLATVDRRGADFTTSAPEADSQRLALIGVRPCDLRALGVLGRALGSSPAVTDRIAGAFIVAVNCTQPSQACFCVSAGGGPRAEAGFDLALTELADSDTVRYVVEIGSAAGAALMGEIPYEGAGPADVLRANADVMAAQNQMGRRLPATSLPDLLSAAAGASQWDDIASRCLTCGNCTMVCPTCFCTSVVDTTDVTGDHAERWQEWSSCFDVDYSEMHGGPVRASGRSRYRQWLTHKFGTWHAQFGESGCVGCGRCVAWCPVGIDVTAELTALADEVGAVSSSSDGRSTR